MLRQIVVPKENQFTLEFPDEYLNQQVEILAFPVNDDEKQQLKYDPLKVFEQHEGCYSEKFNRDEIYDR